MPGEFETKNDFKLLWGTWQLSDLIANGALGSVFKAVRKDKGGDQHSVVRILALSDEAKAEKIAHNARILSSMRMTTGLVGYEDYLVVEEGKQWYVILRMEQLDPMKPYFAKKPFSVEEIARLGIELCAGLEQASNKGVVHGDIRESDIFIDKSNGFKLSDFSLARMLLGNKGTSDYPTHIAPEVIKGEKYDVRADIYSLGLVLYRLLNNDREPFYPLYAELITPEKEAAAFDRRMKGDEPPMPILGGHDIGSAVLKALSANPQDRFETPALFAQTLLDIVRNNIGPKETSDMSAQPKPTPISQAPPKQRTPTLPFIPKMGAMETFDELDLDADIPMENTPMEKGYAPVNFNFDNFDNEKKRTGLKLPGIDVFERMKEKRSRSKYHGSKAPIRTKVRHKRRRNKFDLLIGAVMILVVIVAVALWRGGALGKNAEVTPTPNPAVTQAPIVTPSLESSVSVMTAEPIDHQNAKVTLTWLPDAKTNEVTVFYRYKGGEEKEVTAEKGSDVTLTGLLAATDYEVRVDSSVSGTEDLKATFKTNDAPLCEMPGYKTTSVKFFEGPPYSEEWNAQKLVDMTKSFKTKFASGKRRLFVSVDNNFSQTDEQKVAHKSIIVRAPDGSIAYYYEPQEVTWKASTVNDNSMDVLCYDGYEWLTGEYKFERYYDGALAGKGTFTIE